MIGGGGGGGGEHSTSVFYSVIYLCAMISFSLRHNVLCFSFVVVFYSMYNSNVIINGLMKEVVMCNNKWRLKSPLKVNRPLESLLKHRNFDFALFRGGG